MSDPRQTNRFEKLLQPDTLIDLGGSVSGPLDLLQLKDRLARWRLSQNGHSRTSEPTVERMIQFKPETWEALSRLADDLEEQEASVTAAEVATLLIEGGLAQIQNEARK